MLIILAFIILFHITSAILLFISTIKNAWWVSDGYSFDLWYQCNETDCYDIPNSQNYDAAYLQMVQATMILATILCCVGFFVFILQLFRLKQGERFVFTAIIQLLSACTVNCPSFEGLILDTGKPRCDFVLEKFSQLLTNEAFCLMTGASIYTAEHFTFKDERFRKGDYGYSFVLAWVVFPMTLLSGLMYLVLRKRK